MLTLYSCSMLIRSTASLSRHLTPPKTHLRAQKAQTALHWELDMRDKKSNFSWDLAALCSQRQMSWAWFTNRHWSLWKALRHWQHYEINVFVLTVGNSYVSFSVEYKLYKKKNMMWSFSSPLYSQKMKINWPVEPARCHSLLMPWLISLARRWEPLAVLSQNLHCYLLAQCRTAAPYHSLPGFWFQLGQFRLNFDPIEHYIGLPNAAWLASCLHRVLTSC